MDYNPDDLPIRPELYGCVSFRDLEHFILDGERSRKYEACGDALLLDFEYKADPAAEPGRKWYERFLDLFG